MNTGVLFRPRTAGVTALFVLGALSCLAQTQIPPDPSQSAPDSTHPTGVLPTNASPPQSDREKAQQQIKKQEKQRILGIVPQFNVSDISDAVRLTARQKLTLAVKTSLDPGTFLLTGITAGIDQAENSFPEYGQGAEGYGKRFGASYADSFDGTLIGNAIFPIILHQDPRYFRKGEGSIASRLGYAVLSTFRCRSDSGHWQPNYSNVLGNLAAGGISNLYYPAPERGFVSTYQRAIVVSAQGAIGAAISEFWPDIAHHFRKHQP